MTVRLNAHAFQQRKITLLTKFESVGRVTMTDEGAGEDVRALAFETDAPGGDLGVEAAFEYREWFVHTPGGWRLARYAYELRLPALPRLGREQAPAMGRSRDGTLCVPVGSRHRLV